MNIEQIDSYVSPESLCQMKKGFKSEVSPRRLASISSLSNLINILHKQDISKIDILEKIKECPDALSNYNKIIEYFTHLNNGLDENNKVNLYAEERLRPLLNLEQTAVPKLVQLFIKNKLKIYKLVAEEIARKWRSFGREMRLKEGQLDRLEQIKELEERIHKMLEMVEDKWVDIDEDFVCKFCNGLEQIHRKDLATEIRAKYLKLV